MEKNDGDLVSESVLDGIKGNDFCKLVGCRVVHADDRTINRLCMTGNGYIIEKLYIIDNLYSSSSFANTVDGVVSNGFIRKFVHNMFVDMKKSDLYNIDEILGIPNDDVKLTAVMNAIIGLSNSLAVSTRIQCGNITLISRRVYDILKTDTLGIFVSSDSDSNAVVRFVGKLNNTIDVLLYDDETSFDIVVAVVPSDGLSGGCFLLIKDILSVIGRVDCDLVKATDFQKYYRMI